MYINNWSHVHKLCYIDVWQALVGISLKSESLDQLTHICIYINGHVFINYINVVGGVTLGGRYVKTECPDRLTHICIYINGSGLEVYKYGYILVRCHFLVYYTC